MRTTTTIATLLAAVAMFTSACSADVDSGSEFGPEGAVDTEPTSLVSQNLSACGFQEMNTAICDRTATLGSCTELRTEGMDADAAREVCESSDGQFKQNTQCPRITTLLGVCPVEEAPGQLRLHYYYAGKTFADSTVPTLACSINEGAWCSAQ